MRCMTVALLAFLCIGGCVERLVIGNSTATVPFEVYSGGAMPVLTLLIGYLIADTVRLCRAKE